MDARTLLLVGLCIGVGCVTWHFIDCLTIPALLLFQRLAGRGPIVMSREGALAAARAEAERRGYSCDEPVILQTHYLAYHIWTGGSIRSGHIALSVEARTGVARLLGVRRR